MPLDLKQSLGLFTILIAAVWGSAYFWGSNANDSSSSGYIGGALLTFLTSTILIFFAIKTWIIMSSAVLLSGSKGFKISTYIKVFVGIILLLTVALGFGAFLMGRGKATGDQTSLDGGEVASWILAAIQLILLIFLWQPILSADKVDYKTS